MAEIAEQTSPMEVDNKPTNGLSNGLSNGTSEHKESSSSSSKDRHKSSHKDKDRSKDRHSSSHKSSHKEKHRDKDRHRSDKDKDRHKDDKDKDRHKDDKHKESKDKHKDDKDRHKDRHKDDKDRHKSRDDKDRHRSSSDKHKDGKDRHKENRDRSKSDKSKDDKDRHKSDKDKHKSSSSSDKHRSSKSSSSHHHSSSHKSSHKDKHREKVKEEKIKIETIKTEPQELDVQQDEADEYKPQPYMPQPYHEPVKREVESEEEDEEAKLIIKEEKPEEEEEDDEDLSLAARQQRPNVKTEDDEEDDVPLSSRKRSMYMEESDEDDVPLGARKKVKKEKKRKKMSDDEDYDDFRPAKKVKKEKTRKSGGSKVIPSMASPMKGRKGANASPTKAAKKKKEEEEHVWKWWEEEKKSDGKKWHFLEHRGPVFADSYDRLPKYVKFYYDGNEMKLSEEAEEVAGFYARMLAHDYTTKEVFNRNFLKDWRAAMTSKERIIIMDLALCNFKQLHEFYVKQSEDRKSRTKEEKKALKEKNEGLVKEYGWCNIDGHKQKIGNFRIEPPGLFRGRGEHPKQGMLKKRTMPEEVIINCSKDSQVPQPPEGHRWKQVRHDNTVSWLACWNENIQGQTKYVMLNAASRLKGEKDWQKYETARKLHKHINKIRDSYQIDWRSKEMKIRQRGVALYFIDILALRAGNEKDEEQADTVGCCSLRVEHIKLNEEKDGKEYVVEFDFLGKDSIRYYNEITVERKVYKNLQLFMDNKQSGDDLFDRLNTSILNKYLNELLDGLTAKVFRTYNASRTLQEQLEKMSDPSDNVAAQVLTYNRANREVAILCNHQRAVPKTFDKSMANLQEKIADKKDTIKQSEREMKELKKAAKHGGSVKEKDLYEKKKRAVEKLKEQLMKLEISATDKEENKQIALGTSKLNYLDPRISVAWCKRYNIPLEKVYNKTQRQKFQWAIDMATAEYNFTGEPMQNVSQQSVDGESEYEEE